MSSLPEAGRTPVTHRLKTWPEYFAHIRTGAKSAELRKLDRDFRVGDYLLLQEWNPKTESYTGDSELRVITHILPGSGIGLCAGYGMISMKMAPEHAEHRWWVVMKNDCPVGILYGSSQIAEVRCREMRDEWLARNCNSRYAQHWRVYPFDLQNLTRRTSMLP